MEVIRMGDVTENRDDQSIQLLTQIRDLKKKQLMWQRVSAACLFGIFAVLFITVSIIVPRATKTLSNIDQVAGQMYETIDEIDTMVAEMTTASTNLNKLVDENAQSLTDAINSIASIDFEGLNKAIKDLKDTVGPMASFFGRFR
jgi:predicted PurR-regulated permease PerM